MCLQQKRIPCNTPEIHTGTLVFYAHASIDWGHILFGPSVCLFVCKNIYIGHSFLMVSDGAILFHIYIPSSKTLYLVPESRSSVKVKVTVFRKNGYCRGINVTDTPTQLVFFFLCEMCKIKLVI